MQKHAANDAAAAAAPAHLLFVFMQIFAFQSLTHPRMLGVVGVMQFIPIDDFSPR